MLNKLRLTLLLLLFHTSPILAQDYFNENVKFILDCWKYNFGWETLGGGYIRHFLLFTDSNLVVIKTNQISHTTNVSNNAVFSADDIRLIPLTAILNTLFEKILPDPQKEMNAQVKNAINLASENPTVKNIFLALSSILDKKNLKCEIKEVIPYSEIESVEIKGKGREFNLKFKFQNKKYKYTANYNDYKLADKVRDALNDILKGKQTDQNYLSLLKETNIQEENEIKRSSLFLELFGQGLFLSANVDYCFHPNFSFRIGFSWIIFGIGFPLSLSYISHPNSSHHLEIGAGITFIEGSSIFGGGRVSKSFLSGLIGYRYQPPKGGLFFKLSLLSFTSFIPALRMIPGISLGYSF